MSHATVTANQARQLIARGAILVDIREPDEHRHESIPGSRSLPLSLIQQGEVLDVNASGAPVIFHCQSGNRTAVHAAALAGAAPGHDILLLDGGITAWKRATLATEKARRQPLPIMRQVQIVAGSLILTGVLAGYALHPLFFLLAGAVGAGLLFAGLSGWCGMAILLGRMPWNRE